jgi:hypothetical protein
MDPFGNFINCSVPMAPSPPPFNDAHVVSIDDDVLTNMRESGEGVDQ